MDILYAVVVAFFAGAVFGFFGLWFIQKTHVSPFFDIADITVSGMLMNKYIDLNKRYVAVLNERNKLKAGKSLRKCIIKRRQRRQK